MSQNLLEVTTHNRIGGVFKNEPMPSRDELLARNSFSGPSENKYLDKMFGIKGVKRKVIKLK